MIFKNNTIQLQTRDNVNNYLRLINYEDGIYKLCTQYPIQQIYKTNGEILEIYNPSDL